MSQDFLPYGRQALDEDDIQAVIDVLRGDYLTTGPAVSDFEEAFCEATGAEHAIACANGTAALHLALAGLGVGPGDVCVVPAITFAATANAALYCGAEVVFADIDPDTGLMTPDSLSEAIVRAGRPVRVALPVHLAGQTENLPELARRAAGEGADLVEDACHALGARPKIGGPTGANAFSDAATFSFHPVKTIAAGEGGMVTVADSELAERIRQLRSHGVERDPSRFRGDPGEPWRQEMQALGWNYRLTDIQAALARSQLAKLPRFAEARRRLAAAYDERLAPLAPIVQPMARTDHGEACWHLYAARIDFDAAGVSRSDVMLQMREKGVGSQVHYIPLTEMPFYQDRYGVPTPPGAARYYARTLSLPLFYGMEEGDVDRVVETLSSALSL